VTAVADDADLSCCRNFVLDNFFLIDFFFYFTRFFFDKTRDGQRPSPVFNRNTIKLYTELEIRSVERGICPIATSTMNELFL